MHTQRSMRGLALALAVIATGCAAGVDDDLQFGHTALPGGGEDDGSDEAPDTKGNPTEPLDESDGSDGEVPEPAESSEVDTGAIEDGGLPPPMETSTDDGDAPLEESDGAPVDEEPVGLPMFAPCDPDANECADGVCLVVLDVNENVLSTFCTGPCGFPQQDCDTPPTGDAPPACILASGGESLCSLDCTYGATCPVDMLCKEFPGGLYRCI